MTEPNEEERISGGTVDKLTAGSTAGLPISKIITSENTRGGNPDMTQRISQLAVPYGLVVMNDRATNFVFPKNLENRTSTVIPDDLFDKLVNMVEQPGKHRNRHPRHTPTKPRSKRPTPNTQTKRIRFKST